MEKKKEDEEKLEELKEGEDSVEDSFEESGLEGTIEGDGGAMSSEEFARFLQSSGEVKAPVLERVKETISEQENLEQDVTGSQAWGQEETRAPVTTATGSEERAYIPTTEENPYQTGQIRTNIEPPALTPRDTMPQREIPRHELLDPMGSIAGRPIEKIYPDLLESRDIDKKYYKVVK